MAIPFKKRASSPNYVSPNQLVFDGFESPFEKTLSPKNRWVVLARLLPWDDICSIYYKHVEKSSTGRPPLNARIVVGALIIKHLCNFSDQETVDQIAENMYMQYFLGYSSFTPDPPFDSSLFVEFRKRIGINGMNEINMRISKLKGELENKNKDAQSKDENNDSSSSNETKHKGKLTVDATACPQDITYPTDLKLLNRAREISEDLIDTYYIKDLHHTKPRTYKKIARKSFLKTAQKKTKTKKQLRKAIRMQLSCLFRNIKSINLLLDSYDKNPFTKSEYKDWLVINTVYEQQKQMYQTKTNRIEDRIVSIKQPHVRPIVRGKDQAKVEFGAKINVSLVDGISFVDELSWDPFNEGVHLMEYVENYRRRFGFYPAEVLADKIYCNRSNRAALKELGIMLRSKPLGRPSAVSNHVSPGERNPIEGKFGQAKTGYGLNRIRARLINTSETWIAGIFLVLNLVYLAGLALHLHKFVHFSFSVHQGLMMELNRIISKVIEIKTKIDIVLSLNNLVIWNRF